MTKKKTIEITREQTISAINTALSVIQISNTIFPSFESYGLFSPLNKILSQEIIGNIYKYIGEDGLNHVCFSEIASYLSDKFKYSESKEIIELPQLLSTEELCELSEIILNKLESIPEKFKFIIKLPKIFYQLKSESDLSLEISEHIVLHFDKQYLIENYPTKSQASFNGKYGSLARLLVDSPIWENETAYLSVSLSGYCGIYGGDKTIGKYNEEVKSLFGLIFAQLGISFRNMLHESVKEPKGIAFLCKNGLNTDVYNFNLHSDINSALNISLWHLWDNISHIQKLAVVKKIRDCIRVVSKIHTEKEHNPKLKLASQWYYDSLFTSNQTIAFVQATTAIEVLLGDKKEAQKTGLGNLLSNRYAYLTGKNHKERTEKIAQFKELYELRCHIVHSGHNTLNLEEQISLNIMRDIVAKVIVAETR